MKERPILFSGPMVRALLNGSKTQTRRIVKDLDPAKDACTKNLHGDPMPVCWAFGGPVIACPYGNPGERLRVRETFFAYGRWVTRFNEKKARDEWHFVDMTKECDRAYQYAADEPDLPLAVGRGPLPGWWKRPAIFMPRAACRIQLEIVSVRVERLNDCSESDAKAEGIVTPMYEGGARPASYSFAYSRLWDSINGGGSWAEDPWVWVVEFKRVAP